MTTRLQAFECKGGIGALHSCVMDMRQMYSVVGVEVIVFHVCKEDTVSAHKFRYD